MKQGPEVELTATDSMVHCRIRGGPDDNLKDVCRCAHTEFQWIWSKDDMAYIDQTEVRVVRPD